jgi:hypothetical protein
VQTLNLAKLKRLKEKPIKLSKASMAAIEQMESLYKDGKVFEENDCAVRRTAEVYLAACHLSDCFGKDLGRHLGSTVEGATQYTILYNMRIQFKVKVGPHKCAVGSYDFDQKVSRYEGLVSC